MFRLPFTLLLAACWAFCAVLALDLLPSLRGDFGWRWGYEQPEPARVLPLALVVALYSLGALRLRRGFVLWGLLGAISISVAALFIQGDPLYLLTVRTLSGGATGAHMAGISLPDLGLTLRDWPRLMATFLDPAQRPMPSVHIALAPPGLPALYYGMTRLAEALPAVAKAAGMALRPYQCQNLFIMGYRDAELASAWLGVLMPMWAALAVLPLYRVGGRWAALWWPLVPAVALFTPNWNTAYPALAVLAFHWLDRGLHSERYRALRLASAGAAVSLLSFLNISTVPLGLMLGLYLLFAVSRIQPAGRAGWATVGRIVQAGAWFGLGLASLWMAYFALSGVTPLDILTVALGQHFELDRPYLPWVFLHLYDLLLFTGLPLTLVALLRFGGRQHWRQVDPLAATLVATLVILAVSGTARGETGRVWLFFAPFFLVVAARYLDGLSCGAAVTSRHRLVMWTQALMLVTLCAYLRTMGTELAPPPARPQVAALPVQPAEPPAIFGGAAGQFTLVGWQGSLAEDGAHLTLTLQWHVEQRAAVPYYFSAIVVRPDGTPQPEALNWQPFETHYPVTCWAPGATLTEQIALPLVDAPAVGDYWISLAAFDIRTGERLPVHRADNPDTGETQVGLGPVRVP